MAAIDAAAEFEGRRELLNPEMEPGLLVDTVQKVEALTEMVYRLGGFASLWFSADTQSQPALAFRNRIQQVMTGVQDRVSSLTFGGSRCRTMKRRPCCPPPTASPTTVTFWKPCG